MRITLCGCCSRRECYFSPDFFVFSCWQFRVRCLISGEPTVDARIRSFALDVLLAQIMAPSADWKYAVAILCQCQAHEQETLKATLSEFVDHFLHSSKTR